MPVRFAINGLGRIGRALLRVAHERSGLELVAANDLEPPAALARLVARDTVHGPFPGEVAARADALVIDGRPVPTFSVEAPEQIPWARVEVEVVVEATGRHLARDRAAGHLRAGAERVILTANSPDADVTLCLGVNDEAYDAVRHRVVSNASCTTNCAALVAAVLDDAFGVRRALMSTVHSVTVHQRILDCAHPDPRLSRAALGNIIPTATTAPEALGRVLPALAGRVRGFAVRVPTPEVAMLDLVAELASEVDAEQIRHAFRTAARGRFADLLGISEEELVSSDFIGSSCSAVVDLPLVDVVGGRLCRVVAWYDNEWGYANRLADLIVRLASGSQG